MTSLLLLSSNQRRQYVEDIQTALAAPVGAVVQFRYLEKFVMPALRGTVTNQQADGMPVVVGFASTDGPFVLPIRSATVAKVEHIADMIIFKLRVGGYPDLTEYPESLPGLVAKSRDTINQLAADKNGGFYPVTSTVPQIPAGVTDHIPEGWLAAARRLALHPTFEKSYFLRVAPVETRQGKKLRFDKDGRLEVDDGQPLRIVTNFWGGQYAPDADFKLTCPPDGTNLRAASREVYHVGHKYDSVEFWQFLAAQNFDTFAQVTISLASEKAAAETVPAHVELPLVVKRSRSRMFWRWIAASAGAVLVALPAMVGEASPLALRIVAALAGAGLLALSSAVLSSPK
ncbi:hypothetical protein ACGFIF_05405 [Kribbella sp. NPDC049174]|uniref:hypothetical protein n=1 Tax=Kribbella sp. NPDC049174 TaxID=3364112 RepID=UPI003717B29C